MSRVLSENAERRVRVVAIDVEGLRRPISRERAKGLRKELGGDFPVVSADERVIHLYGKAMGRGQIPGTPTFFVIDRDGFIYSYFGGIVQPAELMAPIEFLYGVDRYRPDAWK